MLSKSRFHPSPHNGICLTGVKTLSIHWNDADSKNEERQHNTHFILKVILGFLITALVERVASSPGTAVQGIRIVVFIIFYSHDCNQIVNHEPPCGDTENSVVACFTTLLSSSRGTIQGQVWSVITNKLHRLDQCLLYVRRHVVSRT